MQVPLTKGVPVSHNSYCNHAINTVVVAPLRATAAKSTHKSEPRFPPPPSSRLRFRASEHPSQRGPTLFVTSARSHAAADCKGGSLTSVEAKE